MKRTVRGGDSLQTWIMWPDCHIPFEDKHAFGLVLKVAQDIRPHGQVIIGDFADMLSVSAHPKTPPDMQWQLSDEVDSVNHRLDQLDSLGCKTKHFCVGNHETRGQRLAMAQAIGLYKSLDPDHLFRLSKRGWKVHPYQEPVKVGKVWMVHDTDFGGPDAAKQNGDMFQASTVQGHNHAAMVRYTGAATGEKHVSATIGWLGDFAAAKYMAKIKRFRHWIHSFGLMRVEGNGNSHVQVIPIIEGHCVVDGKLYV